MVRILCTYIPFILAKPHFTHTYVTVLFVLVSLQLKKKTHTFSLVRQALSVKMDSQQSSPLAWSEENITCDI